MYFELIILKFIHDYLIISLRNTFTEGKQWNNLFCHKKNRNNYQNKKKKILISEVKTAIRFTK